jgi:hypothetical protein
MVWICWASAPRRACNGNTQGQRPAGCSQQRRRISGLGGILIGILIGALVVVVLMRHSMVPMAPKGPQPNPEATAQPAAMKACSRPASTTAPKKPQYDFYSVLSEKEVRIPDSEISAQAKAEQQQQAAQQQATHACTGAATAAKCTQGCYAEHHGSPRFRRCSATGQSGGERLSAAGRRVPKRCRCGNTESQTRVAGLRRQCAVRQRRRSDLSSRALRTVPFGNRSRIDQATPLRRRHSCHCVERRQIILALVMQKATQSVAFFVLDLKRSWPMFQRARFRRIRPEISSSP